jgi:hypothetical protein
MRNWRKSIPAGAALLATVGLVELMSMPMALAAGTLSKAVTTAPHFSMQQAKALAVSTFSIPSSYTVENESYSGQSFGNQPSSYSFGFQQVDVTTQQPAGINVVVDANSGRILNYNRSSSTNRFVFPVPTSADDAKQTAVQWIQKLYPQQANQVVIQPLAPQFGALQGPVTYAYNFVRMVDNIPAPFNGFSITIDQNNQLTSVNAAWSDMTFPSIKNAISSDKANQVYQQALNLHLVYSQIWHADSKPTTELMYTQNEAPYMGWGGPTFSGQPQTGSPVIQALTGQVIDGSGMVRATTPYQAPKPVVPGGPTLPSTLPQVNWDESQALQFAQKVLGLPSSAQLQNENQWSNQNSDTTWNFSWKTSDNEQINAAIDTTYGELQNYSEYPQNPPQQSRPPAKLSQSQVDATVNAFVKKVFSNNTGAITVVENTVDKSGSSDLHLSDQILPILNGIPNQAQQGSIQVNPMTGRVQNLWLNTQQSADASSLPLPTKAISPDKAKQAWIDNRPLALEYLMTQPQQGPIPVDNQSATPQPAQVLLAYAPVANNGYGDYFNAETGTFESPQTQVPYTGTIHDLDGVTAAPQLQLLVNRELVSVDTSGNVHPTQNLTNSAFVKLVVDALGQQGQYNAQVATAPDAKAALSDVQQNSPDYQEIVVAYQLGWLPQNQPFQPNEQTTRGEASQILARALDYQPLLSHPESFQLSAGDASGIPKDQFAGDALATGLGIFSLQNGNFNAQGNVTLADAAVAVVQSAVVWGQERSLPFGYGPK